MVTSILHSSVSLFCPHLYGNQGTAEIIGKTVIYIICVCVIYSIINVLVGIVGVDCGCGLWVWTVSV